MVELRKQRQLDEKREEMESIAAGVMTIHSREDFRKVCGMHAYIFVRSMSLSMDESGQGLFCERAILFRARRAYY